MKILLEQKEVEQVLLNSLCNGALTMFQGYNLAIDLDKTNYNAYRAKGECFEDILIKALKGGERLYFADEEGDENASFSLEEATEILSSTSEYAQNILNILEGNDDATDGDIILQLCLYNEVQFG